MAAPSLCRSALRPWMSALLLPACCSCMLAVDKYHEESHWRFYANPLCFPGVFRLNAPYGTGWMHESQALPPGRTVSYCFAYWSHNGLSDVVYGPCEQQTHDKGFNMPSAHGPIHFVEQGESGEPRCLQHSGAFHWMFRASVAAWSNDKFGLEAPWPDIIRLLQPEHGLQLGVCTGEARQQFWRDLDGRIHLASHPDLCLDVNGHPYPMAPGTGSATLYAVIRGCDGAVSFTSDVKSVSVLWEPGVLLAVFCAYMIVGSLLSAAFLLVLFSISRQALKCLQELIKTKTRADAWTYGRQWWKDEGSASIRRHAEAQRLQHFQRCLPAAMLLCFVAFVLSATSLERVFGRLSGLSDLPLADHRRDALADWVGQSYATVAIAWSAFAILAYLRGQKLTFRWLDLAHAYFSVVWALMLYFWAKTGNYQSRSFSTLAFRFLTCYALGNWRLCALAQALTSLFDVYLVTEEVVTLSTHFSLQEFTNFQFLFVLFATIVMATIERGRWSTARAITEALELKASVTMLLDTTSDGFCHLRLPDGIIEHPSLKMESTFAGGKLDGVSFISLVQEEDHELLGSFYAAGEKGLEAHPILLTCRSMSERLGGQGEVFDVRVVPYAKSLTQISVCICVQGERRLLQQVPIDDVVIDLPEDTPSEAPQNSRYKSPFMDLQQQRRPSKSVLSAPVGVSVPVSAKQMPDTNLCSAGDCLPADAEVQFRSPTGQSGRKKIGDLQPSDFVLCFDHLSKESRYAAVQEVSVKNDSCLWARMTFEDGTEADVTADHPIRTSSHVCAPMKKTCDLEPGQDFAMITKTLPVLVKSVSTWQDSAPRVSVTLNQSMRFSMFVHYRGAGQAEDVAIAVESADYLAWDVRVKSGFIHVKDEWCDGNSLIACSAPSQLAFSGPQLPLNASSAEAAQAPVDASSHDSESAGSLDIILTQPGDRDDVVALSTYVGLRESGLTSIGAAGHGEAQCKPCRFQYNYRKDPQHKAPCQNSSFCEFCHEEHSEQYYRQWLHSSKYEKKKEKKRAGKRLIRGGDADRIEDIGGASSSSIHPAVSL